MSETAIPEENIPPKPETKTLEEIKILLEQYKLFVGLTDQTSARRIESSKFYITVLSGLLIVIPIIFDSELSFDLRRLMTILIGVLGIVISIVWIVNIRSYKQLNSLKFKVIHEMEQYLPYPCFQREWEILKTDPSGLVYKRLSQVEQYVPIFLLVIYSIVLLLGIFST